MPALSVDVAFGAGRSAAFSPPALLMLLPFLALAAGLFAKAVTATPRLYPEARTRIARAALGLVLLSVPVIVAGIIFWTTFSTVFVAFAIPFAPVSSALVAWSNSGLLTALRGLLMIACGVYLAPLIALRLANKVAAWFSFTLVAAIMAVLLSAAVSIGWVPAVGPVLGAILSLGSTVEHAASGIQLAQAYSLGFTTSLAYGPSVLIVFVPFGLLCFLFELLPNSRTVVQRVSQVVQVVAAVLLVVMGLLVVIGFHRGLNGYAISLTSQGLLRNL
jgi:cytochrome c biogenesis protein CcdA